MLKMYLDTKPNDESIVTFNDEFFENNIHMVEFTDEVVNLIKGIDGVKYEGNMKFLLRDDGSSINILELSTGCKTAVNIVSFPNKVFSIGACNGNALRFVHNLSTGSIYVPYPYTVDVFSNDIEVISVMEGQEMRSIIKNQYQLQNLIWKVFGKA